jgi:hypothetical protein
MREGTWLSVALLAFAVAGCGGKKPANAVAKRQISLDPGGVLYHHNQTLDNLKGQLGYDIETWSAVIPPGVNPSCPAGRVFLGYGHVDSGIPSRLKLVDLPCLDNPQQCFSGNGPYRIVDVIPKPQVEYIPGPPVSCSGDKCTCIGPSTNMRFRVDSVDMTLLPIGKGGMLYLFPGNEYGADPKHSCRPYNDHSSNLISRTMDCGNTWARPIAIQPGDLPPPEPGGRKMQQGMDMAMAYVDPFSKDADTTIYMMGSHGNNPTGHPGITSHTALYRSLDMGAHWEFRNYLRNEKGETVLINNTQTMTSTPDGTIFMFGCQFINNEPRPPLLLWSHDSGKTFHTMDLSVRPNGEPPVGCTSLLSEYFPDRPNRNLVSVSLSRVSTEHSPEGFSTVRAAYTFVEPNDGPGPKLKQSFRVVTVAVPVKDHPRKPEPRIVAEQWVRAPGTIMFQGRFVEPSLPGRVAPGVSIPDTSVFFWQEVGSQSAQHRMMYQVVRGTASWSKAMRLSTQQINGKIESATWFTEKNWFLGDWDQASFFPTNDNNHLQFFINWSQTHAKPNGQKTELIHYNVVRVPQ